MPPNQNFYQKVYQLVKQIPAGRVTSYGHIAILLGHPRGARTVGYALSVLPNDTDVPWHRVINKQGRISIRNQKFSRTMQKQMLEEEGIPVEDDQVDMKKYGWFVI